ncbi:hypothetical protein SCWH03_25240 [Streptomyces pacificus]|uniref:Uncharacterized protein n=1 Tax=Streptomyces pacificus TaxID=2705029 RepID=A0A6A0AUG9_9ACTN|nr:hypothetical protein SCWH03_25240 [Streptomyces pacificus]
MLGEHPRYGRLPDVGPYEIGCAETVPGSHRVDAHHPFHSGIPLDTAYEAAPELSGHTGDKHDPAQDQRLPFGPRYPSP